MPKPYDKKQPTLSFRVSEEEHAALIADAMAREITLADLLRERVLDAITGEQTAYAAGAQDTRDKINAQLANTRALLRDSREYAKALERERSFDLAAVAERDAAIAALDTTVAELKKRVRTLQVGFGELQRGRDAVMAECVAQMAQINQMALEIGALEIKVGGLTRDRDRITIERNSASEARDRAEAALLVQKNSAEREQVQAREVARALTAASRIIEEGESAELRLEFASAQANLDFLNGLRLPRLVADMLCAAATACYQRCILPIAPGQGWLDEASALVARSELLCQLVGLGPRSDGWNRVKVAGAQIEGVRLFAARR